MAIQLGDIAALVDGQLVGDPQLLCCGANPPGEAGCDQITMLDDPKHVDTVIDSGAMAAVTTTGDVDLGGRPLIIVDDAHHAFAKIVAHFRPPIGSDVLADGIDPTAQVSESASIHPSAIIASGVTIGPRTRIMPGVVILPNSTVGADCVVHAGVTLYEYTQLADRVVIHAGSVIGAHGFGYRQENGRHVPTAQLGYVAIESDVELGAGVTVDRGTYGATRIGEGTKIDNQVMIGHNCKIGKHNLLCSQVGIAGSCTTGDYVILAGQVGLKDHITLGDQAVIGAQAGVMDNLDGNQVYLGSPATTQRDQMQIMAVQRRLPEMRRDVKQLRRDVDQLTKVLDQSQASNDPPSGRDQRAA